MIDRRVRLADICTVVGGGTPTRSVSEYYGGAIPWVTPKDMKAWEICGSQVGITQAGLENSAARLVPPNSVLVVVRSGVLKHTVPVAINRVPVAINQDMKALLCDESADPTYVARFIKARSSVILQWVRATTADNFPIDNLRQLEVPLPSIAEQRRIAAILDKADELRARRRAALAQLDTLAQSIFLDMFGDPVTNPKGWPNPGLGAVVAQMQYGPRFYNEPYAEDGIRVARITDLNEAGELDFDAMPRMRIPSRDIARMALEPGDLIFARSGATVGKVALYGANAPPCIPGAYFIRLKFKDGLRPEYARGVLTSSSIRSRVAATSRQSAQQNFSGPGLRRLPIPVPPLVLQERFARQTGAIAAQKELARAALVGLDALFASVQDRAFRGQL